jgi:hypothetical protein
VCSGVAPNGARHFTRTDAVSGTGLVAKPQGKTPMDDSEVDNV